MAIHPVQINNSFGSHSIFWLLFLPLLSIIFFPMFIKDQNITEGELAMISTLGADQDVVGARTNSFFKMAFIETGVLPATEKFFGTDKALAARHTHDSTIENTKFADHWIRGVWVLIYKAIWRINMLISLLLLPLIITCAAAAIDGFSIRAKKSYSIEGSNSVFFYTSTHAAVFTIGLFFYLPLLPVPLSPYVLGGFILALAISIWVATSNFQTGS